jgi:tetratricopeptide (TPR) repeat protein
MSKFFTTFSAILLLFIVLPYPTFSQSSNEPIDKNKLSAYFQNEQYTDAVQYLEARNVLNATDQNSLNDLGYAYYMSKKYAEAKNVYSKTLALDSLSFIANKYLAYISHRDKDYKSELFYYLRLLRIQPSGAALYKLAGDAYNSLKSSDTALLYYARAYRLLPANEDIAYAYADELMDQDMYPTSDSVATEFLKTDSLNFIIIRLAIKSLISGKKMGKAAALTQRWLTINEPDPKTAVYLAQANYNIKNYEACFKVGDTLLKQGYETESLFYYASQGKYKLNDFNASSELLKQCLKLAISKNANIYYFSAADNLEALKQYKKAIAAYDTAFYLFKDPLALYNIGRLYEQGLKNKPMAYQYYKKYVALARPSGKDEQRVYAYVKEILAMPNPK